MARIQFILKHRDYAYACDPTNPAAYSNGYLSSGLFNSARFVQEMLRDKLGHVTQICHVVDNNCIDRLVTRFKPDICVIEAYWIVPEKFEVLSRLHPKVKWVVRNHSAMPFLATEGVVIDWSLRYMNHPNVIVSCNDLRTDREFRKLIADYKPEWSRRQIAERCIYLPNYYPPVYHPRQKKCKAEYVDIACFGAIRPLKNHLIQAAAAIHYADSVGKILRFHINSTRVEGGANPILKNLRKLFELLWRKHRLIEHPWLLHHEFINLVRRMDIGMQVSNSETFNIVTADMVMNGVPVVVSPEVGWVDHLFHADPNDSRDIVAKLKMARMTSKWLPFWKPNVDGLRRYDRESVRIWHEFIG
jgi:hypothetical protein